MLKMNADELRKATNSLPLPLAGYVARYLGSRRWGEYVDRNLAKQRRRKQPPARPTEPPRGPGVVLGPSSPASFVSLEYDGSSVLTLSATDGHLIAVARVRGKPTGPGRPWSCWVPWWRWVHVVARFDCAFATIRPLDGSGAELTNDRLRVSLVGPAAGLSPDDVGLVPPLKEVVPAVEVGRPTMSRVIRLFAKAAWPAPRHRTELVLERDGRTGVTVGTVTWTARSDLRLPFVFSPSTPSLEPTALWLRRLGSGPNPEGRVTVERVADVHDRTFYRFGTPSHRHTLWVPEARALEQTVLDQFAHPRLEGGSEVRLPIPLVRQVAAGTLHSRGRRAEVAVDFRPAADGQRGEFRIRGLGRSGIEGVGAVDVPAPGSPSVGWSVALPARNLIAALAPLRGEMIIACPLGKGFRLVLSDIHRTPARVTTAVVRCHPASSDAIDLTGPEDAESGAQQE